MGKLKKEVVGAEDGVEEDDMMVVETDSGQEVTSTTTTPANNIQVDRYETQSQEEIALKALYGLGGILQKPCTYERGEEKPDPKCPLTGDSVPAIVAKYERVMKEIEELSAMVPEYLTGMQLRSIPEDYGRPASQAVISSCMIRRLLEKEDFQWNGVQVRNAFDAFYRALEERNESPRDVIAEEETRLFQSFYDRSKAYGRPNTDLYSAEIDRRHIEELYLQKPLVPDGLPPLVPIHNAKLRRQVFTTRSYAKGLIDPKDPVPLVPHNEGLEFLGDSYLNILTSRLLFAFCPDLHEGELTIIRSSFISNDNLARLTQYYGLDKRLLRVEAPGASGSNKAQRKVFGDIFEAYLAGVILDSPNGANVARDWIWLLFKPMIMDYVVMIDMVPVDPNARTYLYAYLGQVPGSVIYRDEPATIGYKVRCELPATKIRAVGQGLRKQDAAARAAMAILHLVRAKGYNIKKVKEEMEAAKIPEVYDNSPSREIDVLSYASSSLGTERAIGMPS